ncbi:hypothetical protein D3C77_487800 [compost metagenome]
MRSRRCAARIDTAATARVTRPPYTSHSPPKCAEAPACPENSNVHRRSTAYRPTLVMMANSAATGALAEA